MSRPSSWTLSPLWLGWALWLGSVSSCPPLGRAPGCVSRPCPPVVLLLPAPHELCQLCGWAVAGLCVQALSSCPPLGRALALLLAAPLCSRAMDGALMLQKGCAKRKTEKEALKEYEREREREREKKKRKQKKRKEKTRKEKKERKTERKREREM